MTKHVALIERKVDTLNRHRISTVRKQQVFFVLGHSINEQWRDASIQQKNPEKKKELNEEK